MIEAVVEDPTTKEDIFRRADAALPPARDPRLEHELDPDRLARRGHRPARPGDRDALLQPGAGAAARRGDPRRRDLDETAAAIVALARDLGKEPVEARDVAGFVANRILMPFINEAVARARRRGRERRGDRHGREARLRPPARAARARRPDRARHVRRDHGGARARPRRREYAPPPAPARARRRGPARPEVRRAAFRRVRSRPLRRGVASSSAAPSRTPPRTTRSGTCSRSWSAPRMTAPAASVRTRSGRCRRAR